MEFKLKQVTLIGRMNDINFQAVYEISYEEDELTDWPFFGIEQLTKQALAAGVKPPVEKPKPEVRAEKPKFPWPGPVLDFTALSVGDFFNICPTCGDNLKAIGGKSDKQNGRRWVKVFCDRDGYKAFLDDKMIRDIWG